MIRHAAEIWMVLAACFALGALAGSVAQRAIALTALGKPQARLIRGIDRLIRWLERRLLPWRGTVPPMLPQTVPIPPPDFGHGVEAMGEADALEPVLPRVALVPGEVQIAETAHITILPPARVAPAVSQKQAEWIARGDVAGVRPSPLSAPRQGQADPLHLVRGITRRHASRLGQIGIFHFSQIASWTPQELAWIAAYLGAGEGPVTTDWVGQSIQFASAEAPIAGVAEEVAKAKDMAKLASGRKPRASAKGVAPRTPGGDEPLRRHKSAANTPPRPLPKSQPEGDKAQELGPVSKDPEAS